MRFINFRTPVADSGHEIRHKAVVFGYEHVSHDDMDVQVNT